MCSAHLSALVAAHNDSQALEQRYILPESLQMTAQTSSGIQNTGKYIAKARSSHSVFRSCYPPAHSLTLRRRASSSMSIASFTLGLLSALEEEDLVDDGPEPAVSCFFIL